MYSNKKIIKILKFLKKHKKYNFFIIFIAISIFIVIKTAIKKTNKLSQSSSFNHHNTYVHQSEKITITIYNTKEKFQFKFKAENTQHFLNQKTIQFIQPKITIFNTKNIAIWKITANQAILNYAQKILYLYGYIYINNISQNKYFQSIITNQATVNLTTKEIFSNKIIILHGYHFYSIGKKMYGNLHTKKIKIFNDTQTYYETKYIPYISKNNNFH